VSSVGSRHRVLLLALSSLLRPAVAGNLIAWDARCVGSDDLALYAKRGSRPTERLDARLEAALERTIERVKRSDAPEVTLAREIRKLIPDIQQGIELARKAGLKECAEGALPTEQGAT
jgi:hypothetical protein